MDATTDPQHGPSGREDNLLRVLAYHQLSKHHLSRYAPSPGHLDWANQPDPFRTFAGAPRVELPLLADALSVTYADLYISQPLPPLSRSGRGVGGEGLFRPRRLDVHAVAILFELALGLSAWKEFQGSRWALRCNPSSGNLHPTEGYAIVPSLPGIAPGIYHYLSRDHVLEQRRPFSAAEATQVRDLLPPGSFLVGLSSIHWREAWKYGVRAYRYCQLDGGHALAALRYAAAALGWSARLLSHLGDDRVSGWLGLDRGGFGALDPLDREHPDALVLVGPPGLPALPPDPVPPGDDSWQGNANRLSPEHVHWQAIDEAARAAHQPSLEAEIPPCPAPLPALLPSATVPAATLIRARRSCLDLDGRTFLDAATFYRLLDHLLPRPDVPPWDVLTWEPLVHAAIMVHRVRGLEAGLYLLARSTSAQPQLRAACHSSFAWQKPNGCPAHLPLYLLAAGDYRESARTVSCHQEIASDGAFSLGMIAWFRPTLQTRGPWWYRRLFWEAGVLGQVLYLEAEAAGVRGTGIGCYFDDPFHRLLGLTGDDWQDLYHFTVGGPVEDRRLRTMEPYAHLTSRAR
jgi:SagB-type dehydrogenase family enzyme